MKSQLIVRRSLLWIGLTALIMPSCTNEVVDPIDNAACEKRLKEFDNIDAIEWLKTPTSTSKMHGEMTDDQALALAMKLQEYGAERLLVLDDASAKGQSGDLAVLNDQGMIVQLPADLKRRVAIFQLYAKQSRISGMTPRADSGQKYLFINWTPRQASRVL